MSDILRFTPDTTTPRPSKEVESALVQLFGNCHTCFFATHCHVAKENANARLEEERVSLVEQEFNGDISFEKMLADGTKQASAFYEKELDLIRFEQQAKQCPGPTPEVDGNDRGLTTSMICNNPLAAQIIEQGMDFTPLHTEEPDL